MLGHEFVQTPKARSKEVETGIKNLPLAEKIRALAIYRYYQEINKIEELKLKESKEVEKKFLKLEDPIIKAQNAIINGDKGVTVEELLNKEKFLSEEELKTADTQLGARKIPEYWLKAMKNCDVLKEEITKNDDEALKHLHNIHVVDEEGTDNFEIVFTFSENPFFKNKELKKKFILKDDYPTSGEGTVIEWEQGKDLTKKQMKKKQKNKKTGQSRVVNKIVDADSFFNFFGTVSIKEDTEDVEADEEELKKRQRLEQDFEIGGMIVDECVPYSLEYYLGVKAEEDDEDFEEDDSDDDDDGDKDEEEEEPKKKSKSKGKGDKSNKAAAAAGATGQQPECKQQ